MSIWHPPKSGARGSWPPFPLATLLAGNDVGLAVALYTMFDAWQLPFRGQLALLFRVQLHEGSSGQDVCVMGINNIFHVAHARVAKLNCVPVEDFR